MSETKKSVFDSLQPKVSFFLGLASGLAIIFTIGFFILLYVFLGGGAINLGKAKSGTTTTATNTAVADTNTDSGEPDPSQVTVAPVTQADWVFGDRSAKVSIIEYSDTECPFCKRHHETLKKIIDQYKGKVNWVYRHFPIESLHSKAPKEAEATECAGELGGNDGFWKFTNRVFEVTPTNNGLDPAELPKIAKEVGLNVDKFNECYNSGKYKSKIDTAINAASTAGARGTPYNVIVSGDQKVPVSGAYPAEKFTSVIDSML